ncbi:MAG: prevent-host-death protein [Kiritimatiellae bacterium]|nr:prevent-host-death protein [Kiritimatiellia bacterium]
MEATIPAQEIKRRGISALNKDLADGPVWVISGNEPKYVVLLAEDFRRLRHEAFVRGCLQSEAEHKAGNFKYVSPEELMREFDEATESDEQ